MIAHAHWIVIFVSTLGKFLSKVANIQNVIENALSLLVANLPLELDQQPADKVSKLFRAISKKESLNLFLLAKDGIEAESSAPQKAGLSRKMYYTRLRQLVGYQSPVLRKIIAIGEKYGIQNIDSDWIDALAILNFIETITTKFLMDHDYTEQEVKNMKWEEKLTKLQNKLYEEAKIKQFTIRTSAATFFKSYREVRNDQDHIAHLPQSHVTKDDIGLLQKNLDLFVKAVFVEHKEYCLKQT